MALSRAVLIGAALAASAHAAVPFRPAPVTSTLVLPSNGFSPAPTQAPDLRALHRRDDDTVYMASDNTCAFVSGDLNMALTCGNGNSLCAYSLAAATTYGYAGCCVESACQTFYTACMGFVDYYATGCDEDCEQTLFCSSAAAPYCNTASVDMGSSLGVYAFYCDATSTYTIEAALSTYLGERGGRSFTMAVVDSDEDGDEDEDASSTTFTSASTISSAAHTRTTSSTQTSGTSSASGSSTSNSGSGSKTNTGAIVGGVVGGVGGLALIAGLLAFFLIRSRRKNKAQTPMPPAGAPGGVGGGPPGYPPNQPQYAAPPVMSQMSPPPPSFDAAMQKTSDYGAAYSQQQQYSPPPPQPAQPLQQQQQYAPVDRTSSTSPMAAAAHMSQVSAQSSFTPQGAVSPQTPGTATLATGTTSGVPSTVHEAGSNVVGGASDNHRGQMHELA